MVGTFFRTRDEVEAWANENVPVTLGKLDRNSFLNMLVRLAPDGINRPSRPMVLRALSAAGFSLDGLEPLGFQARLCPCPVGDERFVEPLALNLAVHSICLDDVKCAVVESDAFVGLSADWTFEIAFAPLDLWRQVCTRNRSPSQYNWDAIREEIETLGGEVINARDSRVPSESTKTPPMPLPSELAAAGLVY